MCVCVGVCSPPPPPQEKRLKELDTMMAKNNTLMSLQVQKHKMESAGQAFVVLPQKKQ